ncbi:MAG TPA: MarR family winged helix-turn-helix transcriptional regulator [Candidatus Fusicatenibacter intestinigallinarum]|uniref:MarR family winged helix-turn-helix transcriptional regulator n=1 Tax=Candidatus Fusicatenibacter intestinigallinarum TaxID=2838598 RepID=A0A9D2NCE0_9FIRM|nr:MarR family winged helix-turn-helix transcriptional regulator [Candidatus Fusicatenibacter intestinigallinarum]
MENQDEHDCTHDVGRLINTLSHQLKRQISFPEEESSLTNIQRVVLNYILFQVLKREVYQKDIEKEFQIRRSTATAILQLLERKGFICRETAEWDARFKKLIPTEKTEKLREQIISNTRYMENLLKTGIPEEDLEVCLRVLERMSENLSDNEKTKGKETIQYE